MKLQQPTEAYIQELMSWFKSQYETEEWGGPKFRYPFDLNTFQQDLKLDSLMSFVLTENQHLLAFGQCYLRQNRCHLGRLAVSPTQRGKGIIARLITDISSHGKQALDVSECSLFVLNENTAAINAYLRYGFRVSEYPEAMPFANCLYMTVD